MPPALSGGRGDDIGGGCDRVGRCSARGLLAASSLIDEATTFVTLLKAPQEIPHPPPPPPPPAPSLSAALFTWSVMIGSVGGGAGRRSCSISYSSSLGMSSAASINSSSSSNSTAGSLGGGVRGLIGGGGCADTSFCGLLDRKPSRADNSLDCRGDRAIRPVGERGELTGEADRRFFATEGSESSDILNGATTELALAGVTERGLRTVEAFPRPATRPMLPADTPRLSDAVAVAARPRGLPLEEMISTASLSSADVADVVVGDVELSSITLCVPELPLPLSFKARARSNASFFSACCLRIFSSRSCLIRSASGSPGGFGAAGNLRGGQIRRGFSSLFSFSPFPTQDVFAQWQPDDAG